MKNSKYFYILLLMAAVAACSPFGKLYKDKSRVTLALPANRPAADAATEAARRDSLNPPPVLNFTFVSASGDSIPVGMSVEWDSVSHENLTTMTLNEVVVTAGTMRNTAERNGLINLEFVVTVPKALQQDNWMVNVRPVLMRGELPDSLKELRFTGLSFREAQERDYRRYDRFLQKIIPDSIGFGKGYVNYHSFEVYLERLKWYRHGLEKRYARHEAKMKIPDPLLLRFALFNRRVAVNDSLLKVSLLNDSRRMIERLQWQYDRALARANDTLRPQDTYLKERYSYFNERWQEHRLYYSGGVDERLYGPRFDFFNDKMERMNTALSRHYSIQSDKSDSRKGVKYLRNLLAGRDTTEAAPVPRDTTGEYTNRYRKIRNLFPTFHFRRPDKDSLDVPRQKVASTDTLFSLVAPRRKVAANLVLSRFDSTATVQHYMNRYERLHASSPGYNLTRELVNPHSPIQWHARQLAKYGEWVARINALDTTTLIKRFYNTQKMARNEARKAAKDEKFKEMVPFPYNPEAQLDTVIYAADQVKFLYSQKVPADENSARMKVFVVGDVLNRKGGKYPLPKSDTLTYLVSSMTKFVDKTPHFVRRIVTRDAEANTSVNFNFPQNEYKLDESNAVNRQGMKKVKDLTLALMTDPVYLIDSLTLFATSSPEGGWQVNGRMARKRAESIREVLSKDFAQLYDSLGVGAAIEIDETGKSVRREVKDEIPDLPNLIMVHTVPEDWAKLRRLILADTGFKGNKEAIVELIDREGDPDRREWLIKSRHPKEYTYMFDRLYPMMRAVDFRFSLSRKGMKQDTVYTNEPDTAYARGVYWLEKRKYEKALEILRPYEDVNTGIAYMSLGYDKAALRVLQKCSQTAETKYMEAVLNARLGDEQQAVLLLLRAAEMNRMMRSRANLDPELSALVKKYKLFAEEEDLP